MSGGSVRHVVRLSAYVCAHSQSAGLKASQDLALRIAGPRYRYGVYRCAYVVLSAVLFIQAIRELQRLPDRDLYRCARRGRG